MLNFIRHYVHEKYVDECFYRTELRLQQAYFYFVFTSLSICLALGLSMGMNIRGIFIVGFTIIDLALFLSMLITYEEINKRKKHLIEHRWDKSRINKEMRFNYLEIWDVEKT